jgi:predicted Zn-ribbon and HTH transcriptional regulator
LRLIPLNGKSSIKMRKLLEACDMIVYRNNRPFALFLQDEPARILLVKARCLNCGYEWGRPGDPVFYCPRCKSFRVEPCRP